MYFNPLLRSLNLHHYRTNPLLCTVHVTELGDIFYEGFLGAHNSILHFLDLL